MKEILTAHSKTDYVFIRVSSELNNVASEVIDLSGSKIQLVVNTKWKLTDYARICGEVISAPDRINTKDFLYENYPGSPKPMQYRGHEMIKRQMDTMPGKVKVAPPYLCGGYEASLQTLEGVQTEVQVGDTAYFHYNSLLNSENFAWREDDGRLVYQLHYSALFCVVRESQIIMLNGYVFVSEVLEEGVEEIEVAGRKITGKTTNGLVTSVDVSEWVADDANSRKKMKKTEVYHFGGVKLNGILEHIGKPIGKDFRSIPRGTQIFFRNKSEFVNHIEGKDYFTMRQWDIVGAYYDGLVPVGDYVMLENEEQDIGLVYDGSASSQEFRQGQVFVLPGKKKVNKTGIGTVLSCGENAGTWTGKRVSYYKSGYMMKDKDKIFIRAGDILGEYI